MARAETIDAVFPSIERMVDDVLVEFAKFVDAVEPTGNPAAVTLRVGLIEAAHYRANPPESWPGT